MEKNMGVSEGGVRGSNSHPEPVCYHDSTPRDPVNVLQQKIDTTVSTGIVNRQIRRSFWFANEVNKVPPINEPLFENHTFQDSDHANLLRSRRLHSFN
jgi:hypothetical protein